MRFAAPVYLALRLWAFWSVFRAKPVVFPDSADYLRVSHFSLLSSSFYTWWKPWGLPLFYKVLHSTSIIPAAQWAVSCAAWLTLAQVASKDLRRGRIPTIVAILGLSLATPILQWDGDLLTESFSLSLTVLFIAGVIALVRAPRRTTLALTLVAAFALAMTRDTNAYFLVLFACPAALLLHRHRRYAMALAGTSIAIAALSVALSNIHYWETPMSDVMLATVIPDPPVRAYFQAHGMPAVRNGLWTSLYDSRVPPDTFDKDPRLGFFRPWFKANVRRVYADYLISHPSQSLVKPLRNLRTMLDPPTKPDTNAPPGLTALAGLDSWKPAGLRNIPLAGFFYLQGKAAFVVALILTALATLIVGRRRKAIVPLLLLASSIPMALLIWNGDPTGIDRHSFQLAATARVGFWLLALVAIEEIGNNKSVRARLAGRRFKHLWDFD